MPKIAIEIGSHAVIGIGLSHWIVGSTIRAVIRDQPIAIPSGTPATMARRNPLMTRSAEKATFCSHVPTYGLSPKVGVPNAQLYHAVQTRSGVGSAPPKTTPPVPDNCQARIAAAGRMNATSDVHARRQFRNAALARDASALDASCKFDRLACKASRPGGFVTAMSGIRGS